MYYKNKGLEAKKKKKRKPVKATLDRVFNKNKGLETKKGKESQ